TIYTINRYGEDLPDSILTFDPGTRSINLGAEKTAEDISQVKARITSFLEKYPNPTESDILAGVEGRTSILKSTLKALLDENIIERDGTGKKGDPFKYRLQNACSLVPSIVRELEKQETE
ncbi:MAG: hypothetical protein WCQ99_01700, partial [Pseudomonadota bacterium]